MVNRNLNKFLNDFCFQLTEEEKNLWLQNGTTKISKKSKRLPRVFTEQGVAMLATVLKTENASSVSRKIVIIQIKY